jgi:transcriptional regulator with XRE-family HTH domain
MAKRKSLPLFAIRLKELRVKAELSQAKLAAAAGVSLSVVFKTEQGIGGDPGWSTVQALAKALGVDCTAFAENNEERPQKKPKRKE